MRGSAKISLSYDDVVKMFMAQGLTDENLWVQAVANNFQKQQENLSKNIYHVTVNYYLSLAQMIANGNYNWKNSSITEKDFPLQGKGKQEVSLELLHLNRSVSTEQILAEINRLNFRPATLPELLALGTVYPELQREFPIVALGSSWVDSIGSRYVPCLWSGDGERRLGLNWCENGWVDGCRLLLVRK